MVFGSMVASSSGRLRMGCASHLCMETPALIQVNFLAPKLPAHVQRHLHVSGYIADGQS